MRFVLFYHSLLSDWNHGNAHFLRGVVREMKTRGHEVRVLEPKGGWSRANLLADQGMGVLREIASALPDLTSLEYDLETLDLDQATDGADVVIVHEWNDPALVARLSSMRKGGARFRLLFHDTHHRAVSERETMARYDLSGFDGVLAFGNVIRDIYLHEGWTQRAWTWHEAADTTLFRPHAATHKAGDLVWIGNWGDGERSAELGEFLLRPVSHLGLKARVHGVRYPEEGLKALAEAGIDYAGWLPNHRVPATFAHYRVTVHVPRRYYATTLPGIPTIRVFEALACGIPLISAPWEDAENLFTPGEDYLVAKTGLQMQRHLRDVLNDRALADHLVRHGLETIRDRHSCGHRVEQLLAICRALGAGQTRAVAAGE
ncbi:glycosyltransferase [Telmatospirillum sp. J64-1]|uniref:CgeB family protein n=1 Tax=Telmatospirillum sp. J64-1 TaxID=2502183 RepID=UPI00115E4316|nr:glycosyltransferase [Telmatospirillum sp. J64-1]